MILAKIKVAEFTDYAFPGDQLRYDAVLEALDERGGVTGGTVLKNGVPIGRVDLIFSHVSPTEKALDLPEENFVFTDQFLGLVAAYRRGEASKGVPVSD